MRQETIAAAEQLDPRTYPARKNRKHFGVAMGLIAFAGAVSVYADDSPTSLDPIQIREFPDSGYTAAKSSTATKTETPVMETPVSVQVVPKGLLDDQQANNLSDVYKNVSGMQPDYGFGNWDAAFLRGFSSMEGNQNAASYRDGLRTFGRGGGMEEMSNVEQVEVVKGPASLLYGRIEPGGLINVITKKPESDPYYSGQQQVGSYSYYRTTLDATGPITTDKSLLYRIDGAIQDSKSFRDVLFSNYTFVAPSVTWRPNTDLELNLDVESRRAKGPGDYGVPALVPGVSKRLWVGDRTDNAWLDKDRENFHGSYRLNDDWKLRSSIGLYQGTTRYDSVYVAGGTFDPTTGNLQFAPWVGTNKVNGQSGNVEVTGHFDASGARHELLTGVDAVHSKTALSYYTNGFAPLPTIFNVFHPVYGFVDYGALNALAPDFLQSWTESWWGAYIQDQISVGPRVHLLVGGRYDSTATSIAGTYTSPTLPHTTYSGFKPRIGVLYQTESWLAVYGSYAESLGSLNPGISGSGGTFKPEQAKQYEAGLKATTADGRLNAALAVYQITKTNVISPDPNFITFNVASGEIRSRGVELDVTGKLSDRISIVANYAYTDAIVTHDDNGFLGLTPPNVAKNTGNLWAKFAMTERLSFGGGVFASGSRYGDSFNTFKLPGYARFDAMAAYRVKLGTTVVTAQVNVNNVFDRNYLANTVHIDTTPAANIVPGAPRSVLASLKAEF